MTDEAEKQAVEEHFKKLQEAYEVRSRLAALALAPGGGGCRLAAADADAG